MPTDAGFAFLFFASAFKPIPEPWVNKGVGAGVYLLLIILSTRKLFKNKNFYAALYRTHRLELVAGAGFLGAMFVSLLCNAAHYGDLNDLILGGVGSMAVLTIVPLSYFLFLPAQEKDVPFFGLTAFVLLHLVALGQFISYDLVAPVTSSSLAADVMAHRWITSIMPGITVYGTLAAVTTAFAFSRLSTGPKTANANLWATLFVLSLLGGCLSASRNFFFSIGAAFIAWACRAEGKKRLLRAVGVLSLLALALHVAALSLPRFQVRYARVLPYLNKLKSDDDIRLADLRIDLNGSSGRWPLWQRAVEMWTKNPFIGLGPGAFRTRSGYDEKLNVHNFYLQTLAEGGLAAFCLLGALLLRVVWNQRHKPGFPVLIAVLATLVFDNFTDYCVPWTLAVGYMLAQS